MSSIVHVNTFIVDIFTQVDMLLDGYVKDGYKALVDAIKGPLAVAATLYIGLITYYWYSGAVSFTRKEFTTAVLKLMIFLCLCNSMGYLLILLY